MAGGLRVRDRQSSVIQRWSKGTGRQAGLGREVRRAGKGSRQAKVKNQDDEEREPGER
jgi:hypothetical protein